MTIRGVNVLTVTIMAVIGRIDRFATADSLVNYAAGLSPRQRSSAGKSRNGSITKAGSKRLRWALTEAAQSLCRTDGPYRNLCKRLERKGKSKGVAAIACARKLLTAIWCMLTRCEPFHHAEPELSRVLDRKERRLKAARLFVEERKKRQHQVIHGQLALLQQLASRRMLMPVPLQLLGMFGRTPTVAATG
ncbi:MAG: transposase [Vulcanimicrobiota bacterium]